MIPKVELARFTFMLVVILFECAIRQVYSKSRISGHEDIV
jgi:hypothetical protein